MKTQRYNKESNIIKSELSFLLPLIRSLPKEHFFYLAGGALRAIFSGNKPKDYDIFCNSRVAFLDLYDKLNSDKSNKILFESDNAITYKHDSKTIQLISKVYGTQEDILNVFDMTICQCSYDFITEEFLLNDNFLYHLAAKRIIILPNLKYPFSTLFRVFKYQEKGFTISPVEIIKLILQCRNLKCETLTDWKDQLQGIDTILLSAMFEAFQNEKNKSVRADDAFNTEEFLEYATNYVENIIVKQLEDELG